MQLDAIAVGKHAWSKDLTEWHMPTHIKTSFFYSFEQAQSMRQLLCHDVHGLNSWAAAQGQSTLEAKHARLNAV
jgi:hypothetical protein